MAKLQSNSNAVPANYIESEYYLTEAVLALIVLIGSLAPTLT